MEISKQQCKEFMLNPKKNPLTGRSIEIGKITHQRLVEACEKHKTPSPASPKGNVVPPMGPMIHWDLNAEVTGQKRNNMLKFLSFYDDRMDIIDNLDSVSELECNEILDILKIAKDLFTDLKQYEDNILADIKRIKKIIKNKTVIHDLPKKHVVKDCWLEVTPDRLSNREHVLDTVLALKNKILHMNGMIKDKIIDIKISSREIEMIVNRKVYLDYLIEHHIFTYDDIYKHTFSSEDDFKELQRVFKEYSKLYKKIKGKSP